MAESALISITDIQEYRRIDPKFNANRLNAWISEVQRINLRDLLGDELYYALMSDSRTDGIYKELVDGKEYQYNGKSIQFYGLKPVLVYWWLALAAREGEVFISEHGAIEFIDNSQQNFESAKNKLSIASQHTKTAQRYANDVIKFLNVNASTYPLWQGDSEINETEIVTFRV